MKDFKKTGGSRKERTSSRPSYGPKRPTRSFGAESDRPVEMHQATCSDCGKKCDVPFRPNGKKPVYCRDCFHNQEHAAPAQSRSTGIDDSGALKTQLGMLNSKLDRLIEAIEHQTRTLSK